jgi:hypothetical protein
LWLKKVQFSASTFVVKIATFAKPETVMPHCWRTEQPSTFGLKSNDKLPTLLKIKEQQARTQANALQHI